MELNPEQEIYATGTLGTRQSVHIASNSSGLRFELSEVRRLPEIYQKTSACFLLFFFFLMAKSFVNKKAASAQKLKVGS